MRRGYRVIRGHGVKYFKAYTSSKNEAQTPHRLLQLISVNIPAFEVAIATAVLTAIIRPVFALFPPLVSAADSDKSIYQDRDFGI